MCPGHIFWFRFSQAVNTYFLVLMSQAVNTYFLVLMPQAVNTYFLVFDAPKRASQYQFLDFDAPKLSMRISLFRCPQSFNTNFLIWMSLNLAFQDSNFLISIPLSMPFNTNFLISKTQTHRSIPISWFRKTQAHRSIPISWFWRTQACPSKPIFFISNNPIPISWFWCPSILLCKTNLLTSKNPSLHMNTNLLISLPINLAFQYHFVDFDAAKCALQKKFLYFDDPKVCPSK